MKRDQCTVRLRSIAKSAARGSRLFELEALYVFGSYSRGALECGDLDLIVVVGEVSAELETRCREAFLGGRHYPNLASEVRKALLGGLRKVDLHVKRAWFSDGSPQFSIESVSDWKPRLVWSREHPDWEANLQAIQVDPEAGRFERNHLIEMRRTGSTLSEMELVMQLLDSGELHLDRLPMFIEAPPSLANLLPLCKEPERRAMGRAGKDTARLWPYALDWLLDHGGRPESLLHSTTMLGSPDGQNLVHMGRIDLGWMLSRLAGGAARVCLIAHIRRNKPNDLLIFSRGKMWITDREARQRAWRQSERTG